MKRQRTDREKTEKTNKRQRKDKEKQKQGREQTEKRQTLCILKRVYGMQLGLGLHILTAIPAFLYFYIQFLNKYEPLYKYQQLRYLKVYLLPTYNFIFHLLSFR